MLYFDDIGVGDADAFGRYQVSAEEIRQFARAYDPQPFHLDEAQGTQSAMGVFCASGWHTAAMAMRMLIDHLQQGGGTATMGSPGVDELRWLRPVVPGDVLHMQGQVVETRPSATRPDRGLVRTAYTVLNQRDEPVMTYIAMAMMRRRAAPAG